MNDDHARKLATRIIESTVSRSNGCIEWDRYITPEGYGRTKLGNRHILAHRLAWMLVHGDIPEGMVLCHKCDNRRCINVDHLFIGTRADNNADRDRKGRTASGSRNGRYIHGRKVGVWARYNRRSAA